MADAQQWRLQGVSVYVSVCRLSAVLVPMPCLAPPQPPAPTLHSLAKMRFWYLRWVFDTILSMTCSIHKAACLSSFVCCVILYVWNMQSLLYLCCLHVFSFMLRPPASVCGCMFMSVTVCVVVWVCASVCGACAGRELPPEEPIFVRCALPSIYHTLNTRKVVLEFLALREIGWIYSKMYWKINEI